MTQLGDIRHIDNAAVEDLMTKLPADALLLIVADLDPRGSTGQGNGATQETPHQRTAAKGASGLGHDRWGGLQIGDMALDHPQR